MDRLFHKGIHFRFRQVGILPVQVVLSFQIKGGNVLPPVVEGIGGKFLHEVISEVHRIAVEVKSPEIGMIPEVFEVQFVPVLLDLPCLGAVVGRFPADISAKGGEGNLL